jgi:uncharacterized membrane protein
MERALAHDVTLQPTAQIARHPIHPMLVSVPIVCFIGALITDITYAFTAEIMWADFSSWFLVVGFIIGVLAAIAGLIDFLGGRGIRALGTAWLHLVGNLIVLVLAFLPVGLVLSIITVLILPVTGWLGWTMVYRYGVGAAR